MDENLKQTENLNQVNPDLDIIDAKKQFWISQWESLIKNFLKRTYGLSLYSPHILIDDIITEINENQFKNADNKKYFYDKLDRYCKEDQIIKDNVGALFKILRANFNTEKNNLILETCLNIKKQFDAGIYFDKSVKLLINLICNNTALNLEVINGIKTISQSIIVELLKKGYVLEDIREFASNIFDTYQEQKEESFYYVSTKFPHKFQFEDYGVANRDEYYEKIKNSVKDLTIEMRILALSNYFYKERKKVHYLFVVEGLKGSVNIEVGKVILYSIDKRKFINSDRNSEEDMLLMSKNKDYSKNVIIAAVEVDYLLPKSSLIDALNTLANILDLISCHFKTKTSLDIDTTKYIVVENGQSINSSWSRNKNDKFIKYEEALDLEDLSEKFIELNDYSISLNKSTLNIANSRLNNAIHWYSKAEQTLRQEDKMLNYWIAIENLFNLEYDIQNDMLNKNYSKIQLIQEIIVSSEVQGLVFHYGWDLYHSYRHLILNDLRPDLSSEFTKKSNLSSETGERIYLKKIIDCLLELKELEQDLSIKQDIEDVRDFYFNNQKALKVLDEQSQSIKGDILMIYRFRNLIVHNAHFDNALLPYYVWKVQKYSGNLIRKLIGQCALEEKTLSAQVINVYLKKQELLKNLENKDFQILT